MRLDPRSLAFFRVCLALLLLADTWIGLRSASAFYTDVGVLPRLVLLKFAASSYVPWSFHLASGNTGFVIVALGLQLAAAFALLVGWHTRAAVFVGWLTLASLQARNPLLLHGGGHVMRIFLFWANFLPLARSWSIDSYCGRPSAGTGCIGEIAFTLQLCFIYWFGAFFKSAPAWHFEGNAVYLATSLYQFSTPLGGWLSGHRPIATVLTHVVYWWEALGPCLLFVPSPKHAVRFVTSATFIFLHLTFSLFLWIGTFAFVMSIAWVLFLPGWFWDWIAKHRCCHRLQSAWHALVVRRRAVIQLFSMELPRASDEPASISLAPRRRAFDHATRAACALLSGYVLMWNIRTLDFNRWEPWVPRSINFIGLTFRLEQQWNMFAPEPTRIGGWPVLAARLGDGQTVDLLRNGSSISWDYPPSVTDVFFDEKWRQLMLNLWLKKNAFAREGAVEYFCRSWDEKHSPERRVISVALWQMRLDTSEASTPKPAPKKVLVFRKDRGRTPIPAARRE